MDIFTGIDIVKNSRIEKAVKKYGDRFLNKIYTRKEIEYCFSKKNYIQCLSARFAAKEATIKAFYQAFKTTLYPSQIEITGKTDQPAEVLLHLNKQVGKPFKISVSLSHENEYSVACVVILVL